MKKQCFFMAFLFVLSARVGYAVQIDVVNNASNNTLRMVTMAINSNRGQGDFAVKFSSGDDTSQVMSQLPDFVFNRDGSIEDIMITYWFGRETPRLTEEYGMRRSEWIVNVKGHGWSYRNNPRMKIYVYDAGRLVVDSHGDGTDMVNVKAMPVGGWRDDV